MSDAVCQRMVQHTHLLGYSFWNTAAPQLRDYRNADTVEVIDPQLAALLWQRLQPFVIPQISISSGDDRWERGQSYHF